MSENSSAEDIRRGERTKEGVEVEAVESEGAMMTWPSFHSFPLFYLVLVRTPV